MESKTQLRRRQGRSSSLKEKKSDENEGNEGKKAVMPAKDRRLGNIISLSTPQIVLVLGLIFGGCCSNVISLESIVTEVPNAGDLVTFTQFLLVSIEGYIYHIDWQRPPMVQPRRVPLHRWGVLVVLFFVISILNNKVWVYDISVPVHTIFRSGGTITTMAVGVLAGKKYNYKQVLAVTVLTAGVVFSTLSSSAEHKTEGGHQGGSRFTMGVALLFAAQLLTAIQGLVAEATYKKYGKHWRESLFYSHALSLLLFVPLAGDIKNQFRDVWASRPYQLGSFAVPRQLIFLLINATTQYLCVRGVNNLAGHSTALTVTIVLTIRKFFSLVLSSYLFGNSLTEGGKAGALLVFAGAILYSCA
ncbi:UDP-N-acetylglucosamine transporter Yea4p [Trichomonascus vanleenenianus]|uniref:nucleotide sugar transporter family protein n=1 Tax=Trichomonascus vanleenenianus TaxID=2268995 RepID=UPI003ECA5914